jgi:hypothetical protein
MSQNNTIQFNSLFKTVLRSGIDEQKETTKEKSYLNIMNSSVQEEDYRIHEVLKRLKQRFMTRQSLAQQFEQLC